MGDELQTSKRQRIAFEEKTPAPNNIKTFESFDQHYGRKYGIICDNIEVIAGTLVPDKYWCEEERKTFSIYSIFCHKLVCNEVLDDEHCQVRS